jgi:alpha-L-rhamnosidase
MDRAPRVDRLVAEHRGGPIVGIGAPRPRLSWTTSTPTSGWTQAAHEIEIDGQAHGRVESAESVFVAWPAGPLASRARARVRARVWGADGSASPWSDPLDLEAGLLASEDWTAMWISTADDADLRPPRFRRGFRLAGAVARARLYVTSAGIHQLVLNGQPIGDHVLAPGWTAYGARLRYDTHDVTDLLVAGDNALGAMVAD